jgi:hypothetical protein
MTAPDIREAMNSTEDFRNACHCPDISERNAWQVNRICMIEPHDTAFYFREGMPSSDSDVEKECMTTPNTYESNACSARYIAKECMAGPDALERKALRYLRKIGMHK